MYFDPGTGSLIIQLLLAAIASIGAFFAIFKGKIKRLFKIETKDKKKEEKQNEKK